MTPKKRPEKEMAEGAGGGGVFCFFITAGGAVLLFPGLDLWFSGLFYDPATHFFLKDRFLCTLIYRAVEIFATGLAVALPLLFCIVLVRRKPVFSLGRKRIAYLLLVLALGPGLVVNVLLKDHWGRARPYQIEAFGGEKQFTPAWALSDACQKNCAFVSGHASMGFYLFAFAFLWRRHRRKWTVLAMGAGFIVGLVRIMQGSHFVSDVLFSGMVVYGVAYILHRLMTVEGPPPSSGTRAAGKKETDA